MAERRGRLRVGEARLHMAQLRGFPLEDMGSVGNGSVIETAARHALSAYDASYLALAKSEAVPLPRPIAGSPFRRVAKAWKFWRRLRIRNEAVGVSQQSVSFEVPRFDVVSRLRR